MNSRVSLITAVNLRDLEFDGPQQIGSDTRHHATLPQTKLKGLVQTALPRVSHTEIVLVEEKHLLKNWILQVN